MTDREVGGDTPSGQESTDAAPPRGVHSRRQLFTAVGAATVAGAAGWALHGLTNPGARPEPQVTSSPAAPVADGVPGITFPPVPQRHIRLTVLSLPGGDAEGALDAARRLVAADRAVPSDAGEVTVTVGFSPEIALILWPERAALAADLPPFNGDVADMRSGGDLLLQVCAETATAASDVTTGLLAEVPGAVLVWERTGYRDAPTPEGTARTNTGFIDGIINPRTAELQTDGVWTAAQPRDTYVVARRMTIAGAFVRSPVADQEHAIGRYRDSGAPLSGGTTMDEVDLFSKTADGRPVTPVASHVRRAHPANTGRPLMLRRSYSFDVEDGAGLLFVAYLNDPQTFIATQRRLDEMDDLIRHTTTDASGCFFVPDLATL